jgi:hypothetical protein
VTAKPQPLDAQSPITTIEQLHSHLYAAARVEMSTIPLYLYAAYSIETAGDYQWDPGISAFRTIRSVVIEEMLHLCLACNVLVATGGREFVNLYDPDFITTYPSPMLQREPQLILELEPCTPQLMQEIFMPLELPEKTDAPPQPDHYNTIGQFYAAVQLGLETLSGRDLWDEPHPELQYQKTYWNQDGGGSPIVVTDLPSALEAIKTIVEQGEGADADDATAPISFTDPKVGEVEFSHYAKFSRIAQGIDVIRNVRPVPTNPKVTDYDGPVRALAELFNAAYSYVLCMIDAIYRTPRELVAGQPSPRYGLERTFIAAMGGLLFPIADLLVRQPGPDGKNAAPTFEFHRFDDGTGKKDQLIAMCDPLIGTYPSLGGDDGVRRLIGKLPSV